MAVVACALLGTRFGNVSEAPSRSRMSGPAVTAGASTIELRLRGRVLAILVTIRIALRLRFERRDPDAAWDDSSLLVPESTSYLGAGSMSSYSAPLSSRDLRLP